MTTEIPRLETVSLKLNWQHNTSFLGFYVAKAKGYYTDEGLNVNIVPIMSLAENGEITSQVAIGAYDFGIGAGALVHGQATGDGVVAIASVIQRSPVVFFAHKDTGITSLRAMEGHRIGIKGEIGVLQLEALLATVGLTLQDVELVTVGFDMTPFFQREVDVWYGLLNEEPIHARVQGIDIVTFPLYAYGVEEVHNTLFTSADFIRNKPEVAERFIRASFRGWEWAVAHPEEAIDMMLEAYPNLEGDRAFHLASFNALIPLIHPGGSKIGQIDCEKWIRNPQLAILDVPSQTCTEELFNHAIR